jgi:hypothetical protein
MEPRKRFHHKVRIYKEYFSVCPLIGIRTVQPLSRQRLSECAPPPKSGGEGAQSPAGEGLGSPNSDDCDKKLSTLLIPPASLCNLAGRYNSPICCTGPTGYISW